MAGRKIALVLSIFFLFASFYNFSVFNYEKMTIPIKFTPTATDQGDMQALYTEPILPNFYAYMIQDVDSRKQPAERLYFHDTISEARKLTFLKFHQDLEIRQFIFVLAHEPHFLF